MFLEHFKPNFLFKTSTSALNISEAGGERINVKLDIEKDLTEPIDKPIDKTSVKKKVNN